MHAIFMMLFLTFVLQCGDLSWLTPILLEMLRHLYQRCLIEPVGVIAELAEKVYV